jgi:LmbE family N-acetylglucosaminyl deacetylase
MRHKLGRWLLAGFGLLGSYWGMSTLLFVLNTHQASLSQPIGVFPTVEQPAPPQRLLVIAPHPDDEVLGCGGLIAQSVQAGVPIQVVLLTNGDGYCAAAAMLARGKPEPDDYIALGQYRQEETLQAAAKLGLSSSQVAFLGYPDRSLWRLWISPDTSVASAFTKRTRSPYEQCYQPGALYMGKAVVKDLLNILSEQQSTDVYVTHPLDDHLDHMAAAVFIQEAIAQAKERKTIPQSTRLHYYLVHRGDWPLPQGEHLSASLQPPPALLDRAWSMLPLPPYFQNLKREALDQYGSQLALMNRFLSSFLRQNELYLPDEPTPYKAPSIVRLDGKETEWQGIEPVHYDPVNDDPVRHLQAAADIQTIHLCLKGDALYGLIQMRGNLTSQVQMRFYLTGIDSRGRWWTQECSDPSLNEGWQNGLRRVRERNKLEFQIRLSSSRCKRLYLMVETATLGVKVDRTGYIPISR